MRAMQTVQLQQVQPVHQLLPDWDKPNYYIATLPRPTLDRTFVVNLSS